MKKNRRRVSLLIAACLAFVSVFAFATPEADAASGTVSTTFYRVIKSGKTVYFAGDSGIYKFKVKKGKIVNKKRLVSSKGYSGIAGMKKKGKYLYYVSFSSGTVSYLCRVKTSGGKSKALVSVNEKNGYAIKGKKIYYEGYTVKDYTYIKKVMRLDGKKKKNTTLTPVDNYAPANKAASKKGYSVVTKYVNGYYKDYLKTPTKEIYVGKVKDPFAF